MRWPMGRPTALLRVSAHRELRRVEDWRAAASALRWVAEPEGEHQLCLVCCPSDVAHTFRGCVSCVPREALQAQTSGVLRGVLA